LQEERPETGADVSKQLERVKHMLWHGNTEKALERLGDLLVELSFIQARSNAAKRSPTASVSLKHTSAITSSSSRTSASVDADRQALMDAATQKALANTNGGFEGAKPLALLSHSVGSVGDVLLVATYLQR
jgi:hypothetical protein